LLFGFTVAQAEAYATEVQLRQPGGQRYEATAPAKRTDGRFRGKFNIAWRFVALA
jgi:hypothetical protein